MEIVSERLLERHQTELLGFPVVVLNGVYEATFDDGTVGHSFIDAEGLQAAAAVARVQVPRRLTGREVAYLRKAMRISFSAVAKHLGVPQEQVFRWEASMQPLDAWAEKALRELVLSVLAERAATIPFVAGDMPILGPVKSQPDAVTNDSPNNPL